MADAGLATFTRQVLTNNPAWAQLLGLCPLLAVTTTLTNALGLAAASAFVVVGANTLISVLRRLIPDVARLPCFVLIIATFTTVAMLLLEAFAFDLYGRIALFVQIIVTNCMILGRAESFASRQTPGQALLDATGTAVGFTIALTVLGAVRELLGHGSLLMDAQLLFGEAASGWSIQVLSHGPLPLAVTPPGAFLLAGLALAAGQAVRKSSQQYWRNK